MKLTIELDDKLLEHAREAYGAATDDDAIRQAVEEAVRARAYKFLATQIGREKNAVDVPRRRERRVSKSKVA